MKTARRLGPALALVMFALLGWLTGDGELGLVIPMLGNFLILVIYLILYLIGSEAAAGHPIIVSLLLGISHTADLPIGAIAWEFGARDSTFTEAQARLLRDHCILMGSVSAVSISVLAWHLLTWQRDKEGKKALPPDDHIQDAQ